MGVQHLHQDLVQWFPTGGLWKSSCGVVKNSLNTYHLESWICLGLSAYVIFANWGFETKKLGTTDAVHPGSG